ncbi:flagellar protein FliT [Methylophaga thalassica]|uniref:flagellar protein FliT n=1 Tax=Methylophaga aminisulfidivorans TaxID=230105 RepID=UPI003A92DE08
MAEITQVKQLLKLTEAMSSAVEAEKWSELSTLTQQRAELLEQIFPFDNSDGQPEAEALIEKIILLNQNIEKRCRDARQSIQAELGQFNKNKKVAAAYQSS